MKVLVSYLGRNQVFSLEENDKIIDLSEKVSSYFKIASSANIILQRFEMDWDTYIDLNEGDTLCDRDNLKAIIIECTPAEKIPDISSKFKLDTEVRYTYYTYVHVATYHCKLPVAGI